MNLKCCMSCLNASSVLHVKEWEHSVGVSMSFMQGFIINPSSYMWLRVWGRGRVGFGFSRVPGL